MQTERSADEQKKWKTKSKIVEIAISCIKPDRLTQHAPYGRLTERWTFVYQLGSKLGSSISIDRAAPLASFPLPSSWKPISGQSVVTYLRKARVMDCVPSSVGCEPPPAIAGSAGDGRGFPVFARTKLLPRTTRPSGPPPVKRSQIERKQKNNKTNNVVPEMVVRTKPPNHWNVWPFQSSALDQRHGHGIKGCL